MEEKFSVSLELMIQKFKDNAKRVQNITKNVSNKIKENMSVKPIFDIDITNVKLVESRMQELNQIVEESQEIIRYGIKNPAWASWNTETIQKAEKDLKNANAEIEYINSSLSTMNTNLDKNSKSSTFFSNSFKKVQDGMNKSLKSAKRFTLSLFGIQSGIRIVSRAMSAYSSIDQESAKKTQAAWIGLGSMFSWLKDMIADFAIKAVSYINVFIKALTGTDFLANAMAKSMNKASKSAGKLSNALAKFDEITNLGDSASGADVDTSWIDAFKNVKLDQNVVAWLENIATFMKPIVEWIKEAFTWIIENKEMAIGFILGLGIAFGILSGQWKTKILALGIGLAIAGVIKFVVELIEWIKNPSWEQFTKVLDGLALAVAGVGLAMIAFNATNPVGWIILAISAIIVLASTVIKNWDWIKEKTGQVVNWILDKLKEFWNWIQNIPNWLREKFGVVGDIIAQPFEIGIKMIKNIWNGAKQFFSGIKDFFVGIFTLDGDKVKNGMRQMLQGMGNIIIGFIEGAINAFLIPINAAIKLINKIPGVNIPILKVSIPKIPKLAVGTPNVEKSGYAMIHEGEAVVPKKFNSDEYFSRLGTNNSEETNRLLEELIDKVEKIEINPYTTILDVGQAAQKYRTQQSRIMGEELT
ncbi:MAG TPA: hypothetical protein GX692_02755 [Acholeplasmataceae bacterium]|nr:hypothetical protein [Acholeplasmataceae bacterium]